MGVRPGQRGGGGGTDGFWCMPGWCLVCTRPIAPTPAHPLCIAPVQCVFFMHPPQNCPHGLEMVCFARPHAR